MTKRIGGARRKTRHIFMKSYKKKGKLSLTKYFQSFEVKDRVKLMTESSVQNGMYNRRFHGKMGNIIGKRGECYKVELYDGEKRKVLIVHPVHLTKMN
ncbi:50S ribosomal protein L21e [Candidatus Woesearchaeota archaeon]|nr:50S ribosomal protein L21e [Candidatus Woesearchaeota archaeon]